MRVRNFQSNRLINKNCEICHKKGYERLIFGLLVKKSIKNDPNKHIKQPLYY